VNNIFDPIRFFFKAIPRKKRRVLASKVDLFDKLLLSLSRNLYFFPFLSFVARVSSSGARHQASNLIV